MVRHYYIAEPYPDELIGSVLVRTAKHRGLGNKRFAKLIIGSAQSGYPLLMSLQLQKIAACVRASFAELLHHHTPFRFITAFMSQNDTERFAVALKLGKLGSFAALSHSATLANRQPRFCPDCVIADIKQYGESYWHRKHNLPFLMTCHIHGRSLLEIQQTRDGVVVQAPPDEYKGAPVHRAMKGDAASWLEARSLAMLDITFRQNVDNWFAGYRDIAEKRGFPRASTGLCGKSFCVALREYYGTRFFEHYGWAFTDASQSWPNLMLRPKNNTAMVTGKHLVVQAFLQLAHPPEKQSCTPPGRKTSDFQQMDKSLHIRLKARMAKEAVMGRPTARVLMQELGFWGTYRHHVSQLPNTKSLVNEWYQSYKYLRKAGLAR